MIPDFYDRMEQSFQQSSSMRMSMFREMHSQIAKDYIAAIRRIDATQAEHMCADGRTLKQVVGHIAEWDRFLLLASGELLAGIKNPRIMLDRGFLLPDGSEPLFSGVDGFNAFIAERQRTIAWLEIQQIAVQSALLLERIFASVMPADLLDATIPFRWQIIGDRAVDTTAGWFLWGITIEHEGPGHAQELSF
jgi:hypothetical protein